MKLNWHLMCAGYCTHPEKIIHPHTSWQTRKLPALFALIEHPVHELILFDTGYTFDLYTDTKPYPYHFYRWVTPFFIKEEESAVNQLRKKGYHPNDVSWIVLSHLHIDHICGIRDFPKAKFLLHESAFQSVQNKRGISALKNGIIPTLLPPDFAERSVFLNEKTKIPFDGFFSPFTHGYDLFQDGSLMAIDLPGHAAGQIGLLFHDHQKTIFFISDGSFTTEAYQQLIFPSKMVNIITHDPVAYQNTLRKIHQFHRLHPEVSMIPSHCLLIWDQMIN